MTWKVLARPSVLLWFLAAISSALVLVATAQGLGVTPDGVSYLQLATRFAATGDLYNSNTWVTPTHFPPGWSLMVGSISSATGMSALSAARLANVAAAGLLVAVTGRAMTVPGQRLGWLAVCGAAWFASLLPVYNTATNALTEPLFLILCMGALIVLEQYRRTPSAKFILATCILIAGTVLVRYVGVALLVPLVSVLVRTAPTRRVGLSAAVGAIALSMLPPALWYVGAPASNVEAIHTTSGGTAGLDDAALSVYTFLAVLAPRPSAMPSGLFALVVASATVAVALVFTQALLRQSKAERVQSFNRVSSIPWGLFGVSYLALISAQRWWIDREIIVRYWLPVILCLCVVVVRLTALNYAERLPGFRRAYQVLAAILLASTAWNLAWIVRFAGPASADGIGINSVEYAESEIYETLRSFGALAVLSDSPASVAFHAPNAAPRDLLLDRVQDKTCEQIDRSALERLQPPAAVALLGRCDNDEQLSNVRALMRGATVISEPGVGHLVFWAEPPQS